VLNQAKVINDSKSQREINSTFSVAGVIKRKDIDPSGLFGQKHAHAFEGNNKETKKQ
jgi:hypothetical protein